MESKSNNEIATRIFPLIRDSYALLESKIKYLKYRSILNNNPDNWDDFSKNLFEEINVKMHKVQPGQEASDPILEIEYSLLLGLVDRKEEMVSILRKIENDSMLLMILPVQEPIFMQKKLLLAECVAGIYPKGFDLAFQGLSALPARNDKTKEGYYDLTDVAVGYWHISDHIKSKKDDIIQCIRRSGTNDDKKGLAGLVFRKICMPSETRCSTLDDIRTAEKYFLPIFSGDNLEEIFSYAQAAIAYSQLYEKSEPRDQGLLESSQSYLRKLESPAGSREREIIGIIREMHLIRTYAQIGLDDRASKLASSFYENSVKSMLDFNDMMDTILNTVSEGRIPAKLKELKENAIGMAEQYSSVYANCFILAGKYAVSEHIRSDILNKAEKFLALELPVMIKLQGLFDLSEAYAYIKDSIRAKNYIKTALQYSKKIPVKERKEILIDLLTRAASESYLYTHDETFISLFTDALVENGITGEQGEEAATFFIDNLSFIALYRKLGISYS
jgi:hypothetical protein